MKNKFLNPVSYKFALALFFDIIANFFTRKKLILVTEFANWSIFEDCNNIKNNLNKMRLLDARISVTPWGARNKIIHFTSENLLVGKNGIKYKSNKNKIVFTWFHISNEDQYRLKFIPELNNYVDYVHTACDITKQKLIKYGLNKNKIKVVPLGIDNDLFFPAKNNLEKIELKKQLGLPTDKIIIGSFQKDGNGWNEGLEPKLIKGPDIFCDTVEQISKKFPIHIMLTGPARGYVKKRLEQSRISYTHRFFKRHQETAKYFRALDLYIIASREEGGPKALLESFASGIPLISTRVGMVPDIVEDGKDGFIVENFNSTLISQKAMELIGDNELVAKFTSNGLSKSARLDLKNTIKKLFKDMYEPLLKEIQRQ